MSDESCSGCAHSGDCVIESEVRLVDCHWRVDAPDELARLRRRVETLEGRLARVLLTPEVDSRWNGHRFVNRGRVWSGRRAGKGTR